MVAAYPGNPSHPGALTRCKPSCTDQQCGPAKHSRTMTNDCDRSHSAMSRHKLYAQKESAALLLFYGVSDRSAWLTPIHYGETGCTMVKLNVSSKDACISKSQTVLVDSCWCTSFSNSIVTTALSQAKNRPGPQPGWGNQPIPSNNYRSRP